MTTEETAGGGEAARDQEANTASTNESPENRTDNKQDDTVESAAVGFSGTDDGASTSTPSGEPVRFEQVGTLGGITPTVFLNAILNIVTLTLWRFWGRTRVRRYIWSTTKVNGEALEYTGTGFELFRSFFIVILGIFIPLYAIVFAGQLLLPPEQFLILFGLAYIPFLLIVYWLLGAAIWLARRYRLSRTRLRGVRFGQAGSAWGFGWAWVGYLMLTAITFGWYGPAMEMRLARRLWNETYYGDHKFHIRLPDEGLAGPLYGAFALSWFAGFFGYIAGIAAAVALMFAFGADFSDPDGMSALPEWQILVAVYTGVLAFVIVVGVLSVPYQAALFRRKAEMLGLDGLTFRLNAKTPSLIWLYGGNLFILIFTLGFGLPWAQLRVFRYIFNRLEADGELDFAAIGQSAHKAPSAGEGLADAFDLGNVI